MSLYQLIRPLLFRLDPERSHHVAFGLLRAGYYVPGVAACLRSQFAGRTPALPVELMGLHFPNPVGLAAGLDKDARYVSMLADLGFGWLELGTVTPQPQAGNPKQRLFRLPAQRAIINRMGFNNDGVGAFVERLMRRPKPCLLGINIGKNKDTPNERAIDDYLYALRAVYIHAAYITVNISSPNTPGLRALQNQDLAGLLQALKIEQAALTRAHGLYVPLALKIAPDLSDEQVEWIAQTVMAEKFDAVIATNTTLARPQLNHVLLATETGGLSGHPLKRLSTAIINKLYRQLRGRVPIIGVGGIENADDAWEKLLAGADLLQIYTAFIYDGPVVIQNIVRGLAERVARSGQPNLAAAVAAARAATGNR
ncbi:MAG: quinone-dependent dihydroorotate dehydrogenase [Gammaproteobacteria bacterium]|nr:quinone-dependent dihydroorotate dehydrogenase [Gammaproteobacteria bacterium]